MPVIVPGYIARRLASQAIAGVLDAKRGLEDRLAEAKGEVDPRDRLLAHSIATVAMRRLGTIRKTLARFLHEGMPRKSGSLEVTLIAATAQIVFMDVPDHAAVDLAVRAVRDETASAPYAGLANAVLRNIAREKADIVGAIALFDDTPPWLAKRWQSFYGEAVARAIVEAQRWEPTLDLTLKTDAEVWAQRLGGMLLPTGSLRLETHTPVPEIDGFAEGAWWVQDAAAALPARLLGVQPGQRVLDMCAAPGGKTAQLAALGAEVFALDRSAQRMKRVAANLERLGLTAKLIVAEALTYTAPLFDAVLVDAPCSATGTIRRHPDVAWVKRASDIAQLAPIQAELLAHAVTLTKPGGLIVYCTCSLEPEEGETQIATFLRRHPEVKRVPIAAEEIGGLEACITQQGDLRTLPCHWPAATPRQSGLDGFFASRLKKV